jgi:hypothetical protein
MTSSIIDRRSRAKLASAFSSVAAVVAAAADASSIAPRAFFVIPPTNDDVPHPRGVVGAVATTTTMAAASRHRPHAILRLAPSPERGGDGNDWNADDEGDGSAPSDESLLNELWTARRDVFGADAPSNDDPARRGEECRGRLPLGDARAIGIVPQDEGRRGIRWGVQAFVERIREADDAAVVDDDSDDDRTSLLRRMMRREDDDAAFGGPLDGITAEDGVDSWQ